MKKTIFTIITALILVGCGNSETTQNTDHQGHENHQHEEENDGPALLPIPTGSKIFFGNLKEGDKIKLPFKIEMGAEGIAVEPAGELKQGSGHHHLLINHGPMQPGETVPADSTHIHFGKGQTNYELNGLAKGNYTLTLQFADGLHRSYGKDLSQTIMVTIE